MHGSPQPPAGLRESAPVAVLVVRLTVMAGTLAFARLVLNSGIKLALQSHSLQVLSGRL
jgi:hypothetical protein